MKAAATTVGTDEALRERPWLLKVPQAAHLLGLSTATTWAHVWAGRLPSVRFGKSVRIPREALREFLDREAQASGRRSR